MNSVIPKGTEVNTPEGKGSVLYCLVSSSFPGNVLAYCVELEQCDRKRQFFEEKDVEDLHPVEVKSNVISIFSHKKFKQKQILF